MWYRSNIYFFFFLCSLTIQVPGVIMPSLCLWCTVLFCFFIRFKLFNCFCRLSAWLRLAEGGYLRYYRLFSFLSWQDGLSLIWIACVIRSSLDSELFWTDLLHWRPKIFFLCLYIFGLLLSGPNTSFCRWIFRLLVWPVEVYGGCDICLLKAEKIYVQYTILNSLQYVLCV